MNAKMPKTPKIPKTPKPSIDSKLYDMANAVKAINHNLRWVIHDQHKIMRAQQHIMCAIAELAEGGNDTQKLVAVSASIRAQTAELQKALDDQPEPETPAENKPPEVS